MFSWYLELLVDFDPPSTDALLGDVAFDWEVTVSGARGICNDFILFFKKVKI